MNIKEIQNAGIELFDAESENDFSSPKNWKKTFKTIELSLKDFGDDSNSAQILSKITNMINVLVRYGLVSEDIVLETAQLYVFIKEAGLDIEVLKQSYSEFVIEGVSCLCMQNLNDIKTHVFENEKYRYLGKIKIAEYIVELAWISAQFK